MRMKCDLSTWHIRNRTHVTSMKYTNTSNMQRLFLAFMLSLMDPVLLQICVLLLDVEGLRPLSCMARCMHAFWVKQHGTSCRLTGGSGSDLEAGLPQSMSGSSATVRLVG